MGASAVLLGVGPDAGPMRRMLCSEATIVKHGPNYNAAKILYCRSWQCEICRPRRARQLIAQAIRGKAQKFLTLTCVDATAPDPVARCRALIAAWRELRLRIQAQHAIPEHFRWGHHTKKEQKKVEKLLRAARRSKELMRQHSVEFLAVVEAQKNGNPHLHIICRMPFVPQAWISDQMKELVGAKVCDIRNVADQKKLSNYVAKYCGKDPQRFGTCKRYWTSRNWLQEKKEEKAPWRVGDPVLSRSPSSIEEFERTEHCYSRKILFDGKWVVSVYWTEPDYAHLDCEFGGCNFQHHHNRELPRWAGGPPTQPEEGPTNDIPLF